MAPLILGVWVLTRFSGGTGAFGGRTRGAMRGRDGITSQKTVRKPFEKAARWMLLLSQPSSEFWSVPGTTQKRKK